MTTAVVDNSNVIQLSGRVQRWRNVASFARAIAAALIAMLGVQVYPPDMFPGASPQPRTQMVEVKTPALPAPPSAQYVAMLQRERRLAGVHPDGRCRQQEIHGPQGRRQCRSRQEL